MKHHPTMFAVAGLVFFASVFSFFLWQNVQTATPNPGHSASEIDFPVTTVTTTVTLARTQTVVLADATTAAFTITLPSAVTTTPYTIFYIKKIDAALANLITIDGNGAETIDGVVTTTLSQRNEFIYLQSDGTNWRVLSRSRYGRFAYRTRGATFNQWYTSPSTGQALTTGAPSSNNLRAVPFVVEKTTTIDQMAINVTTQGIGSTPRVGIYADNGNNYPGVLVVDAGTQTGAPTGVKTYTTNLPVTLAPGLYWLVHVTNNNAATIRTHNVNSLLPILGSASTLPTNSQFGWNVAFTFAALPATYPGGGTPITAVPIPAIYVRTSQ